MHNKKYTVIVSDRAASMLVNHVRFLARVSPEAAKKLHKEIVAEAKALEYMPESYPWLNRDEIPANKYRKKLVSKSKPANRRTRTRLSLSELYANIPKFQSSLPKLCTNLLKRLSYMHRTSPADTEHSRLTSVSASMLRLQPLSPTVWFTTKRERLRRVCLHNLSVTY